jgi:hypothetical protein
MAKQIARLLGTTAMADLDLPAVAALLRSKGRRGDTVLAHINPKEAALLKKRGGAGTINPDTGLPEFYDGEDYASQYTGGDSYVPGSIYDPVAGSTSDYYGQIPVPEAAPLPQVAAPEPAAAPVQPAGAPAIPGVGAAAEQERFMQPGVSPVAAKPDQNLLKQAASALGISPLQLMQLGVSGAGAVYGGLQGRKAQEQARQAKQETAAIGQPYSQTGQTMMAQAQRGELTPMSQQRLQAARAALAQGIERRGGVGVQQAATQLEAFRQQLLDNQYNYGLKVAQIGDQYAARAIQTGLTQDREIASMMQNLSRALGGFAGSQPGAQ